MDKQFNNLFYSLMESLFDHEKLDKPSKTEKHSKLLTISEIQGFHGDDWGNKLALMGFSLGAPILALRATVSHPRLASSSGRDILSINPDALQS
jgi:hypothetical protein